MGPTEKRIYEFEPFRVDAEERVLWRDGQPVSVTPKAFEILLALVERSGHLVEKDELMKRVWPDTFVEEANLANNISLLRKLLGEVSDSTRFIQTVPKRGYRFTADVRELRDDNAELILEKHTIASVLIQDQQQTTAETPALVQPVSTTRSRLYIAAASLIAVLGLAVYLFIASTSHRPGTASGIRSMAVLPFKSLSTDNTDEYLGLGMSDALITRLGGVIGVTIRPTSAVRKYADGGQDPVAAGRELRVESVLDGSIQKVGDRIRLTAQLISVADGRQLWADKFDARFTDLLTLEDSISERVAGSLALQLSGEERKQLAKRYTDSGEAYNLYLRGRYFWNKRTRDAVDKAIDYFGQAIEKDPNYALAYAGIADSYILHGSFFVSAPPSEVYPKARDAATRALGIDDKLAEAHTSLAMIKTQYDWQWAEAESEFKQAIALRPNYATAHHWYAFYLSAMRRFDEAFAEIGRAQELDPLSLIVATDVGAILFVAGRYDQAIEQCKRALELDPNFAQAHSILALIYDQQQRHDEWLVEREKVLTLAGKAGEAAAFRQTYARYGPKGVAENWLAELKQSAGSRYVPAFAMAVAYTNLGDKDRAFEWLDKACDERSPRMPDIRVMPAYEKLRSDPRFPALVRRIGLEP